MRIPIKLKRSYQLYNELKNQSREISANRRKVDRKKILEMNRLKTKLAQIVGGSVLVNKNHLKKLINIEHRLAPYKTVNGWLQLTEPTEEVWPLYGKRAMKRYKDVQIRASTINRVMDFYKFKKIAMLDGHGRMIHEILSINNKCMIDLYELDEYTYEWHKMFLPNKVNNIKGNIIDHCYEQFLHNVPKFSSTLWYFNFCSIGNCNGFEKLLKLLEGINSRKKENPNFKSCLIITFSNRNYKDYRATGEPTQRKILLDAMGDLYTRIDNGGLMHTYWYNKFVQ